MLITSSIFHLRTGSDPLGREAKRNHRNQHQQRIPPRTGRRKPGYLRFLRPSAAHAHWGVSPVVGARWARFTTEEAAGRVGMWRGELQDFRFHIPLIKPDMQVS